MAHPDFSPLSRTLSAWHTMRGLLSGRIFPPHP